MIVGVWIGIVLAALCHSASDADDHLFPLHDARDDLIRHLRQKIERLNAELETSRRNDKVEA